MGFSFLESTIGIGLTEIPIQLGLLEIREGSGFGPNSTPDAYRITPIFDRLLEFTLPLGF